MNKNKMSMAVRSAMGIAALAGVMATGGAYAQDEAAEVEEVVVLGSRIKRTTNTESQTVISITAADMKLTGEVTVADALRSSTLNSLGSFRESSGSSAQSNATFNLRGAGAARTAILINGRRTVGSPSLGGGRSLNLNRIPMSFVERIEILADRASPAYCPYAAPAFFNIILKTWYDWSLLSVAYAARAKHEWYEH